MAGKAELVDRIAELTGIPKTRVALCYDTLFDLIGENLGKGEKVAVPSFGTFQVSERPQRQGRNPATGATITIKASKNVKFKASKNLKEQL
jgi:DNA-binding protein HU-beta